VKVILCITTELVWCGDYCKLTTLTRLKCASPYYYSANSKSDVRIRLLGTIKTMSKHILTINEEN
jgi:hypothetical protein